MVKPSDQLKTLYGSVIKNEDPLSFSDSTLISPPKAEQGDTQ